MLKLYIRGETYGKRSQERRLYLCLHEESIPEQSEYLSNTWKQMLEDQNHHLIVNEIAGEIVIR